MRSANAAKMLAVTATHSPLQALRTALAGGEITPKAAAERALQLANSNAGKNVYISRNREHAFRDAEELRQKSPDGTKPVLYGVPVSLKDCFDLAGYVTTCGSRFYADRNPPAPEDSAVAARLRSQGAVVVGKTHMHPLAYGITGENPDYGDSTQPRDPSSLTGGSSSGAAASIQEGSALAAIGTDTGGSIRAPAALCGLAGYRASIELAHECDLWRGGVHLSQTFDTLGWLFRDLRDAPILANALFGVAVSPVTSKRLRVACVSAEFTQDSDAIVQNGFHDWQQRLREDGGAEIVAFDSAFWEDAMSIYAPIQASEAAAIHAPATGGDFSHFEKSIAERLSWGASLSIRELAAFRARHAAFRDRMDALLSEHDFLIAPCAPVSRLAAGADHSDTRRAILRYTTPASLAGVPVIALPAANGAGVQLMAARGADPKLLAYAAQLGACLPT
ncbi:MAG TPA: amidase [Candidatus Eisenbacteria bacterium]|jgi:aspartyl-tRNA(Asn)/glutamyl-tRNA(Gln) amidotransferase subunit A|nr:amidase [Candidatus Eisenbacteria bacterium]